VDRGGLDDVSHRLDADRRDKGTVSLSAGARLGQYEILSPLGAGGMGEVYRARHVALGREAAIKVLPDALASDPERLKRFEQEARTASALNHPNIVTIYDIAEHDGTRYLAMELVEGKTLRERLADGPLELREVLVVATQIAEGLARAHAASIVHRDLKLDNVMLTADGRVKILDFGLAKPALEAASVESEMSTASQLTQPGSVPGTVPYMSPEQAAARPVDHRSDQFSFGVVLYELVCGERPFQGASVATVLSAILKEPPRPPRELRPEIPADLAAVILRCLAKEPSKRYASTDELTAALGRVAERLEGGARGLTVRWPAIAAALVVLAALVGVGAWQWHRASRVRWAEREALPEINRLTEKGDLGEAYRVALEARKYIPDSAELQKSLDRITLPISVVTEPPGARVLVKGYATPEAPWETLGETPLQEVRIPYALLRWRIEKEGFEPFEGAPFGAGSLRALGRGLTLAPAGTAPEGMVRVPGGVFNGIRDLRPPGELPVVLVGDYWIDRYEVTNREFKEFVDAGGYARREYWSEPIVDGERTLPWKDVMEAFRDPTGRPGPATWQLGTYPEGEGDLPVGGVSWYEAAAYCAYREGSLPTIYHWYHAAALGQLSDILRFSNLGRERSVPVGSLQGLGPYGTYDMAGNVKEWCWNETRGRRYVLGGAWNDPPYMYKHLVARSPLERAATHGVRCARFIEPPSEPLLEPVTPAWEFPKAEPVSDEVFEAYRAMYAYDRTPLEAEVEGVDDSSPYWRKEVVSFDAAYGNERVLALLFLPRGATPPFQVVVWFPGGDAFASRSSERLASPFLFDFLPRSGRALVYPIYKGMYERFEPFKRAGTEWRDRFIQWSKDLGRTIDYLETREDLDHERLAYYGFSTGATFGPILTAIDPRFRASILLSGGLLPVPLRPEMNVVNFAPRSRVPTLMINGREDFILAVEEAQQPLFDLLGAPEEDKRHALLEGGHLPPDRNAIIREVLDWLDRYLGLLERH
jgi:formylglycine-generating enzyme required for sulfatase activity/dienelactone hydrolase